MNGTINRVHILGASGSGTTTLGRALSSAWGMPQFDTDDYFWSVKFSAVRPLEERLGMMENDLDPGGRWILSGSLCGWGDPLIRRFDLVIFLYLPPRVRLERLRQREFERYGNDILPGGRLHGEYLKFCAWASEYDEGGKEVRSLALHEEWLAELTCPVLRIVGDRTIRDKVKTVADFVGSLRS